MLLPVPPLPSGQLPGPGWPQHAAPTASRVAAAAHFRGLVVQAVAAHGRRLRAQWHVNVLLRQFCQAAAMPTRPLGHGRRPSAALQAPFRPRGLPFAQRAWRHRRVRAPAWSKWPSPWAMSSHQGAGQTASEGLGLASW